MQLQGEMRFVGTIGIDNGGLDLSSRMTHPMSFSELCSWYIASIEYFSMMIKHDCNAREIVISVFDADSINEPTATAIETYYLRR